MKIKEIFRQDEGQGLTEYALLLVLIALVVIVILMILGPSVGNVFSNIVASFDEFTGGGGEDINVTNVETDCPGPTSCTLTVSIGISQAGQYTLSVGSDSATESCSGSSCTISLIGVASSGSFTVSGEGSSTSGSY